MNKRQQKLMAAVSMLKQLSHPVRLEILCHLIEHTRLSVGEIVARCEGRAGQSQISQFLAKMREDDLVKTEKKGQTVFYQIKSPAAIRLITALHGIYCR